MFIYNPPFPFFQKKFLFFLNYPVKTLYNFNVIKYNIDTLTD